MQIFTYYLKKVVVGLDKVRANDFLSLGLTNSFSPSESSVKNIMDFAEVYKSGKSKDTER